MTYINKPRYIFVRIIITSKKANIILRPTNINLIKILYVKKIILFKKYMNVEK